MEVQDAIQEQLSPGRLIEDYKAYKASRVHGGSLATSNWPTVLAHPCDAYAVYMRTVPPQQRRALDPKLGMIFAEGDDQARAIKRDLLDMGYEVEGAEGQMAWPAFQISGRKDLSIRKIGVKRGVDAEIKSCSPFTYDSINSIEDIRTHKWEFIQKWDRQVCLYMVLKGVERYWLVLKNKATGQIKIVEYIQGPAELNIAEVMLKKAEKTNKLIQIGQMPSADMKISTPDLCAECEFFNVCLPELNFGVAAKVLTDEMASELAAKIERINDLKPIAKEYGDLDEEVKTQIKMLCADGGDQVVAGDWVASLKRIPKKAYTVKEQVQVQVKFIKAAGPATQETAAA